MSATAINQLPKAGVQAAVFALGLGTVYAFQYWQEQRHLKRHWANEEKSPAEVQKDIVKNFNFSGFDFSKDHNTFVNTNVSRYNIKLAEPEKLNVEEKEAELNELIQKMKSA